MKTGGGGGKMSHRSGGSEDESGEDAYRLKRDRNNLAVKKSREKMKQKYTETSQRMAMLRAENDLLQQKVNGLTTELSIMKELLLSHARGNRSPSNAPIEQPSLTETTTTSAATKSTAANSTTTAKLLVKPTTAAARTVVVSAADNGIWATSRPAGVLPTSDIKLASTVAGQVGSIPATIVIAPQVSVATIPQQVSVATLVPQVSFATVGSKGSITIAPQGSVALAPQVSMAPQITIAPQAPMTRAIILQAKNHDHEYFGSRVLKLENNSVAPLVFYSTIQANGLSN